MPENLRKELTAWVSSQDMFTIAKLCKRLNQSRIYEIFGEYCGLTSHILKERQACGWLHYENGKLDGFALGKCRQGACECVKFLSLKRFEEHVTES